MRIPIVKETGALAVGFKGKRDTKGVKIYQGSPRALRFTAGQFLKYPTTHKKEHATGRALLDEVNRRRAVADAANNRRKLLNAAAPDLLAACKAARWLIVAQCGEGNGTAEALRIAISKAEPK